MKQNDNGQTEAEPLNPDQIAPGAEAGAEPFGTPYMGWYPSQHIGYPLNQSLFLGIEHGRL